MNPFCGICRRATHNREAAMESRYQNLRKRPVFSAVPCSEAFATGCQPARHNWTVRSLSTSFPFLVLLTRTLPPTPPTPPETLVFHLVPRLTSFLQQCVRTFLLPQVGSCSMQHRSSGCYLVHHSSAMVRVYVLSNSKDPIIPFLAFLIPIESDHWVFDLLHPSDESTYLLFMQQPAFELSKIAFPFVAVKKTDALWPLLCFFTRNNICPQCCVYSKVNMGK